MGAVVHPSPSWIERGKALAPPTAKVILSLAALFGLAILLCGPAVFDKSPQDFTIKHLVMLHLAGGVITACSLLGLRHLASSQPRVTPENPINPFEYAPTPVEPLPPRDEHRENVQWSLPGNVQITGILTMVSDDVEDAVESLSVIEKSIWEALIALDDRSAATIASTIQAQLQDIDSPLRFQGQIHMPNQKLIICKVIKFK